MMNVECCDSKEPIVDQFFQLSNAVRALEEAADTQ